MDVTVRLAKISDAVGILEAHQDSIRNVASKDYSPEQISGWSDHLKPEGYIRAIESGEKMFVAEMDNRIVGFSAVRGAEVMAVYVSSIAVGKKTGRLLYEAVEAEAKKNNIEKLSLSASLTAEKFYQHLGFLKLFSSSHLLSSGIEIPCIRMEKIL